MKRNKMIRVLGLLVFGISLLSVGFVKAAELMQQDVQAEQIEEAEMQRGYVPSLQTLALKYIGKKKIEGNEQLFKQFENVLEINSTVFGACEADVTREVAKIAALEYAKPSHKRVSPLNQYKKANPALGLLIDQGRIEYSLSIKDLMDAGAIIAIEQDEVYGWLLALNNLSFTSLDGLQAVANLPESQVLDLSNNQLKELMPGVLANLAVLRLLYLNNNKLKKFIPEAVANLPLLQKLHIQNNLLQELTPGILVNLPSLQLLDFSNNQLKELTPGTLVNLPSLQWLYLSNNQLKELMPGALTNLPSLKRLHLDNNKLKELKPEILVNLPLLRKQLFLENNELTKEAQRVLRELGIRDFYLGSQRVVQIEAVARVRDNCVIL